MEGPTFPGRAPSKAARFLVIGGIISAVAIGNYLTDPRRGKNIPDQNNTQQPKPDLPQLPFPAKEISAKQWLNTKGGKPVRLADLKGKPLVLEFWRFQCHACEAAIPRVKELETKFKDRIHVVTIHYSVTDDEKDIKKVREYVKNQNLAVPVAIDLERKSLEKDYGFPLNTPAFFLINKEGQVVDYQASADGIPTLIEELNQLLAGKDLLKEAAMKNSATPAQSIAPGLFQAPLDAAGHPASTPAPAAAPTTKPQGPSR